MNNVITRYNQYLIKKEEEANKIIKKYFTDCQYSYDELKFILQKEYGLINDTFENLHKYNIKSLKNIAINDINDLTEGLLNDSNQIELFFIPCKKEEKEIYYSLLVIEISESFVLNHFELVDFALNTTLLAIMRIFENAKI